MQAGADLPGSTRARLRRRLQRALTAPLRRGQPTRRISLALQGGGSFGAFTWGVLDRLLEQDNAEIDVVSGVSAGAVNAVLLADGLAEGGALAARQFDRADAYASETRQIALARGNYAQAIENLQRGAVSSPLPLGLAGMARAYRKAGDTGQAIDCYEKLIALGIRALGWEPQQFWLAAHADLAELYLSRGERAKAAQTLDELARLWKNAYPDLPLVRRMRELQQR
jgi:tetratricopeptide (TPR) repeat protein